MRSRPSLWFVFSLLCLAGAFLLWRWGDRMAAAKIAARATPPAAQSLKVPLLPANPSRSPILPAQQFNPPGQTNLSPAQVAAAKIAARLRYRLSNTTRTIGELEHDGKAVLLENALLDTTQPLHLPIPANLRSQGDPGTYIVQATGPINNAFRALLSDAGANIISYIPNNAYLVRADASIADILAADPETQSVLPYEPYYKLKGGLLQAAVEQQPLPGNSALNVLLFADDSAATISQLQSLGAQVVGQDTSPFGPVVKVLPPANALASIADLPGVQELELLHRRALANDLTRVLLGVTPDTVSGVTNDYLGLNGSGVIVNLNDTGVDALHPDFGTLPGTSPVRIIPHTSKDTDGHGTHVAGIIAGDGYESATIQYASGSVTNANMRGKAPNAKIYIQPLDFNAPFTPDSALQEGAATNGTYISNNSWGYPDDDSYSIESASYDAAVRDALPNVPGQQPLVYVFAAGNNGDGNTDGEGGQPDSIEAPGTGKNVITVGATELPRNITNQFEIAGITNNYFASDTDSSNQVAFFSSLGNVGIGTEGQYGRFKPDVVAPGVFVVSTRSEQWNQAAYYDPTNVFNSFFYQVSLAPGERFDQSEFIPDNAINFSVTIQTNSISPPTLPSLPIYAEEARLPDFTTDTPIGNNAITVNFPPNNNDDFWFYTIHNTTLNTVNFNVLFTLETTNNNNELQAIQELNTNLAPWYRYESGTSMSTPAVSGLLALMEQFFEQGMEHTASSNRPSPALLKGLLINGARTLGDEYDFQVQNTVNYQGWGMANLTNSLPAVLTNSYYANYTNNPPGPILLFDESTNEALNDDLTTGQSCSRTINLNDYAQTDPLRITLVWTDPPGNPAAGVKLVNNLVLVVTDTNSGEVYYGNDIGPGEIYNNAHTTNFLVDPPVYDVVNNVQNIYIQPPLDPSYTITVVAQAVNVNAVTANSNNVAQDYALVVSTGNGNTTNDTITVSPGGSISNQATWDITEVTNGIPLLNQEVGALSPLYGTNVIGAPTNSITGIGGGEITLGATNQWHFYVFTNNVTNNAYVAFATFDPPNLAVPREGVFQQADPANATRTEADLDLFVSSNPMLTNLDTNVMTLADKSLGQGGTESIIYSNVPLGQVYYIGVQSEDRQAAQYGFFGIATATPFSSEGANGSTLNGIPVPITIPVGTAKNPGAALIFAFAPQPYLVQNVVVSNTVTHQLFSDLLGTLSHDGQSAVLNNHTPGNGTTNQLLIYDDSDDGLQGAQRSDGPGSLLNFVGGQSSGLWLFTMVDNSPTETGQVNQVEIGLTKEGGSDAFSTITAGFGEIVSYNTPLYATNLTINVTIGSGGPLQVYVGYEYIPSPTNFDEMGSFSAHGGSIFIGPTNNPPFNPGTYYILLYNPGPGTVNNVDISFANQLNINGPTMTDFDSTGPTNILDDAVSDGIINITNNGTIVSVNVGVRINHPRISDLALTLISPQGTRVLLMENRGGDDPNGAGSTLSSTNVFPEETNGNYVANTNILQTGQTQGTVVINYNFFTQPDDMQIFYGGQLIYDTGLVSGASQFQVNYGPGASTDVSIVMNPTNNAPGDLWQYTASVISDQYSYLTFTDDTNLATIPIKFAVPPFVSSSASGGDTYTNGFEASAVGTYTNGQGFETFTVLTNQVSAESDPTVAQGGNKYVALADGSFTGLVPTTKGRKYLADIAYRGPGIISWWRGESNALDEVGGNNGMLSNAVTFTTGEVGDAFNLNGTNASIVIPASSSLDVGLGNGFTLEGWINPADVSNQHPIIEWNNGSAYGVHLWISTPVPYGSGPGCLDANIAGTGFTSQIIYSAAGLVVTNTWQHVAVSYDKTTGNSVLYLNGVIVAQQNLGIFTPETTYPVYLGERPINGSQPSYYWPGGLDELSVYNRVLSPAEVGGIFRKGSAGKFDPTVSGAQSLAEAGITAGNSTPAIFYGQNTIWQVGGVLFTATSNTAPFTATGLEPGMLLDSLALYELPSDLYYQPEEPLSALTGENAQGQWKLELWDNRVGAPAPAGALQSWQLSFVFQQLTPTPYFAGSVPTNSLTDLPAILVPCSATSVTNVISTTGPVNVYFNQTNPPTGNTNAGDILLAANTTNTTFVLSATSTPPLVSCTNYYLGILSLGTSTINFSNSWVFGYTPVIPTIKSVTVTNGNFLLLWSGPTNQEYQVQVATSLNPPIIWNTFTNIISSTNGVFTFLDNGSQLPFGPIRFYRLTLYP